MKVRADTEVAVLSARNDLDLAISTWLPGYSAQRTDDLDTVMDITRRGGVVLIDLGSPRHEEWVAALRDRGFDGPMVFLDPRGEMTLDLRERVVVPSPPSLSGLLSGFEVARSQQQASQRRRSRRARRASAPVRARRSGPATAGPGASAVSASSSVLGASGAAAASPASGAASAAAEGPVLRAVSAQDGVAEGPSPTRARRMYRRRAERSRSRSSKAASPRPLDHAGRLEAHDGRVPASPGRSPAGAEEQFRQAFRAADGQPAIHRRLETPDGRVRIQTEEELFAGQSATPSLATVLTLPSTPRRRQRRARVGV